MITNKIEFIVAFADDQFKKCCYDPPDKIFMMAEKYWDYRQSWIEARGEWKEPIVNPDYSQTTQWSADDETQVNNATVGQDGGLKES